MITRLFRRYSRQRRKPPSASFGVTYPMALYGRVLLYQSTHFQGFPFLMTNRLPGVKGT